MRLIETITIMALMGFTLTPVLAEAAVVNPSASNSAKKSDVAGTPQATINALDGALRKSMEGGSKIGYSGRYAIVSPVVRQAYDFERIASLTLGNYWSKLNADQQKEFVNVLADFTASTYAARFDDYQGEHFAIASSETLQPGTEGVFSTLTMHNGKVHRFDYLLQKKGGQWKIVNVVADGVSDLSLKRAEYTETMKSKGFPALVAHLKGQIAAYAKGTN
ncbi:MAG: HpnM family protein [Acidithiobacillus sp.]